MSTLVQDNEGDHQLVGAECDEDGNETSSSRDEDGNERNDVDGLEVMGDVRERVHFAANHG